MLPFRGEELQLTGTTILAHCQVRAETENPCPRRAAVEIRGVAFCGPCAREQQAYFAIGELAAQNEAQDLGHKALAEAFKRLRRERRAGGTGDAAVVTHNGSSGVHEIKPLNV